MLLNVFAYSYIYAGAQILAQAHLHICIFTFITTEMHILTFIPVHGHTHFCLRLHVQYVQTSIHMPMCAFALTHSSTVHTHAYIPHRYMDAAVHTYAHS